jgi:hypothetical protein
MRLNTIFIKGSISVNLDLDAVNSTNESMPTVYIPTSSLLSGCLLHSPSKFFKHTLDAFKVLAKSHHAAAISSTNDRSVQYVGVEVG